MLEIIRRFNKREEEGIWFATVQVVAMLSCTLYNLSHFAQTSTEIVETSLDLALTTFRCKNESEEEEEKEEFEDYAYYVHYLFTLAVDVPCLLLKVLSNNDTVKAVHFSVSRNVSSGRGALIVQVCHRLPAEYLFDVVYLLLKRGADPHQIEFGYGVLHFLADREWRKEQGIDTTARLILEKGVCLDFVSRNCRHLTAADLYRRGGFREDHRNANRLPDWLQEGVPKLMCQSAKVIQRNKIPYKSSPVTLHAFVERH